MWISIPIVVVVDANRVSIKKCMVVASERESIGDRSQFCLARYGDRP